MLTINIVFVFSQQAKINGRIINSLNEPIEAATITLLSEDSIFVANTTPDKKGNFELTISKEENYRLIIHALGYIQKTIELKGVKSSLNLGNLVLEENTYQLEEVSVNAKKSIRKVDRQIIFPNQAQIEAATDGLSLLNKISPNHLRINMAKETVTFGATGSVKFQINGMNTDMKDIMALLPSQVLRIEYYDHPGLQFGEERPDAVLNYIIKRSEGGGYFATNLRNAVNTGFGADRITTKVNYKQSEFSFNYFLSYEHYKDRWSNQTNIYYFPGI